MQLSELPLLTLAGIALKCVAFGLLIPLGAAQLMTLAIRLAIVSSLLVICLPFGIETVPNTLPGSLGQLIIGVQVGIGVRLVYLACEWSGAVLDEALGLGRIPAADGSGRGLGSIVYITLTTISMICCGGYRQIFDQLLGSQAPDHQLQSIYLLLADALGQAALLAIQLALPVLGLILATRLAVGSLEKLCPQIRDPAVHSTAIWTIGLVVLWSCLGPIAGWLDAIWLSR